MSESLFDFTFPAQWRNPVVERLTWKTDVLTSNGGAEQRRALRWEPDRGLEATLLLRGADRRRMESMLSVAGSGQFRVPLYHEGRPIVVHKSTIVDAVFLQYLAFCPDFRVGDSVIFHDVKAGYWGRYTVTVVDLGDYAVPGAVSNLIRISGGPVREWPIGTVVYPTFRGRLTEFPSIRHQVDDVAEMNVSFTDTGGYVLPADNEVGARNVFDAVYTNPAYSHYGFTVLAEPPNWIEPIAERHFYEFTDFDPGVGRPYRVLRGGPGGRTQSYRFWMKGFFEPFRLKQFLRQVRGRAAEFWLPTFTKDLIPVEGIGQGSFFLRVENSGLGQYGALTTGRRDIMFVLRDGTRFFNRIAAVTQSTETTEIIGLQFPMFASFAAEDFVSISFMSKVRMDQDLVEFTHPTDASGVTECSLTFRAPTKERIGAARL